jgi:hypothetical protein
VHSAQRPEERSTRHAMLRRSQDAQRTDIRTPRAAMRSARRQRRRCLEDMRSLPEEGRAAN